MTDGGALPDIDALWDYDHPAQSEAAFRAVLPAAQAADDSTYYLELLTQIARTQGLRRDFAGAHQMLDQVQAALPAAPNRVRVRYLLERGRVFNSSGRPDDARPLFVAAWEEGQACHEDALAIDAGHMLAIVAPPDEKLAWNRKALELVERTSDTRAREWGGTLYNNIGWDYHAQGQFQLALTAFHQALAWRQRQGDPRLILIAEWCVARTLRSLGQIEEALPLLRALREKWKPLGGSDGYVEEELGECLLALERPEEAQTYFAQAYAKLSQDTWLLAHEPARLQRLKRLGMPVVPN
jgi:tetratricopeptide (TPR) repeat protein